MEFYDLTTPSEKAAEQAQTALRALAPLLKKHPEPTTVTIRPDKGAEAVTVPLEAFKLFVQILAHMARGNSLTVVPFHAELTTQQAAEILNVSRPFLISLLESNKIPYRTVGRHRRIRMADLHAYRKADEERRKKTLDELTAESEKYDLDY